MGGCITPPTKKQKVQKPDFPPNKSTSRQQALNPLDTTLPDGLNKGQQKLQGNSVQKPKFKKMTGQQFCRIYRIQDNVGTAVRFQGPKYISNYADGIGRVLRVVPFGAHPSLTQSTRDNDVQSRVRAYAEILDLNVYEDEKGNMLILQDYYCGPYIDELTQNENPEQVRRFLSEVHQIIESFHKKNIILGNLSISSFRQTSEFDSTVRLVELNLLGTYDEAMGHAFKGEKSMDWESFSFILQVVCLKQPPIFIPHKLQYVQTSNNTINTLYKGKKIKREELDNIKYIEPNKNNRAGYKFRADLCRLLRLRKRRQHHRDLYYSEDSKVSGEKMLDQALQRLETSRIFERIQNYIINVIQQCQEPFTMHSSFNQSLKKLKAIFVIEQAEKKLEELKEILPLIK